MILFALTMVNDVGTNGLLRMSSSNWGQDGVQKTTGQSDGILAMANNVVETLYIEPTSLESPNRYLVTTIRLRNMSITSPAPTLSMFGMQFKDGKDPFGFDVGFRVLELCIVHDTTTGGGYGYVNGRYAGEFQASRRIEVLDDSPAESISFRISSLAIYSLAAPSLMKPMQAELLPIGSDQTGWNVPNTLDADLGKNDPSLLEPVVSTRADGSQIRVAANGTTLVEAAGSTADGTLVSVSGNALTLGETQKAAKPVLVNATGEVTVTRTSE